MKKFALERIPDEEFRKLKDNYIKEQTLCNEAFIFHVGVGAGFYSEIGGMMEAMLYSYFKKIKFILFADDANFTKKGGGGWNEFFDSFCEENHCFLNKFANTRSFNGNKWKVYLQRNLNKFLKKITGVQYTTQDFFNIFIGDDFKKTYIEWELMSINGNVRKEYAKLKKLAMRYNKETWNEMCGLVDNLNLPENYISVHIRGGDKIQETGKLLSVDYCLRRIEEMSVIDKIKNIFVFTDDYSNVQEMMKKKPDWNIYTLTGKSERGYYNKDFNTKDWEFKRKNLVKLFTMVEICIGSKVHFGDEGSCVNNVIYSCKSNESYVAL